MPIDTSMYQNAQPQQINMPSPLDTAGKVYSLANMGMEYKQQQLQMQTQQAMRDAYANNTDANGNLNQAGFLSDVGKVNPMAAMQYGQQMNAMAKQRADAQIANAQAQQGILGLTMPAMQHLLSMPDDQAADAYHGVLQQLAEQGVPMQNAPASWDRTQMKGMYETAAGTKANLDNMLTQANIQNTQAQTAAIPQKINAEFAGKGAEELGKLNEDVNNASSRKTTGSLIDARTRADRILTLVGRQPGESDQQYFGRLNQYMPQIGTEVGTSLAAIMQGGVPNEELMNKLSPDTMSSRLANLQQQWKAQPTAANQGALLAAYGDVAQKLRDFSAGQLSQITDRAKSAYPYANKYFPNEVAKITAPMMPPQPGGQASGASLAGSMASGGGIGIPGVSSANAASSQQTKIPAPRPGDVRRGFVFNGGNPNDQNNWKKAH